MILFSFAGTAAIVCLKVDCASVLGLGLGLGGSSYDDALGFFNAGSGTGYTSHHHQLSYNPTLPIFRKRKQ
jgi:hypothetical protein